MPNYKAHIVGGVATFIISLLIATQIMAIQVGQTVALQCFVSCVFGSLFPDVDTKSKIQKISYLITIMILGFLAYNNRPQLFMLTTFVALVPLMVNHRTIFHRPVFILFIGLASAALLTMYKPELKFIFLLNAIFFVAGALSHILLDKGFKGVFRI